MPLIFISYSHTDKTIAETIANQIQLSGADVWLDEWEIRIGESNIRKISEGLQDADFVVLLLSPRATESGWVETEWQTAFGDGIKEKRTKLLPAMIRECTPPKLLEHVQYARIHEDFQAGLAKLIRDIQSHFAVQAPVSFGARIESGRIDINKYSPHNPLMTQLVNTITTGTMRQHQGGVLVEIEIVAGLRMVDDFNRQLKADKMLLVGKDQVLSNDSQKPSILCFSQECTLPAGTLVPDLQNIHLERSIPIQQEIHSKTSAEVRAHVDGFYVRGTVDQVFEFSVNGVSVPELSSRASGTFEARIARPRQGPTPGA